MQMQYSKQKTVPSQEETGRPLRPVAVAVVAILYGLWSGVMIISGGLMVIGESYFGLSGWMMVSIGSVVFFMGLFGFLVAWSLWNKMWWTRRIALLCVIIGLLAIPVGTVLSLITLWYLLKLKVEDPYTT